MARVFKEEAYNAKRDEILNFAQQLIYTKGYAQMTIQDILDGMQISRGALYHYFDSKQALLEALVDRMGQQAEEQLLPIVQDPQLSAIDKFRRYFEAGLSWKSSQKALILSLLSIWYSEENAFIRQKMTAGSMQNTPRLLEPMIRQGVAEGVFTTHYPQQAAQMIISIQLSLTDTFIELLLSPEQDPAVFEKAKTTMDAVSEAIERILGAPAGSLTVFDAKAFQDWLAAPANEPASK